MSICPRRSGNDGRAAFKERNHADFTEGRMHMNGRSADAALVKDKKLLFRLDGWNLISAREQGLPVP
jgi:hypothetical protein